MRQVAYLFILFALLAHSSCHPSHPERIDLEWTEVKTQILEFPIVNNTEYLLVNGRRRILSVRNISDACIFFAVPSKALLDELDDLAYISPCQPAKDPEGYSDVIRASDSWVIIEVMESSVDGLFFWRKRLGVDTPTFESIRLENSSDSFGLFGEAVNLDGEMYVLARSHKNRSDVFIVHFSRSGTVSKASVPWNIGRMELNSGRLALVSEGQRHEVDI